MTTETQIQLDNETIQALEQKMPSFILQILSEAFELRRFSDIEEYVLGEAGIDGLNPIDIDEDEDGYMDYDFEMRNTLWKIAYDKLGITDEMVQSMNTDED